MTRVDVSFADKTAPETGSVVVFAATAMNAGSVAQSVLETLSGLRRAAEAAGFSGAKDSTLDLLAPAGGDLDRVMVVGIGDAAPGSDRDWSDFGGRVLGRLDRKSGDVSVLIDVPDSEGIAPEWAAAFGFGITLRAYAYDRFKTKTDNGDDGKKSKSTGKAKGKDRLKVTILTENPRAAKKAFQAFKAIADGVDVARDLVNDPPNVLGPVEFAARCKALEKLGVDVEILGEKEMKKLGMGALLAVAQGSAREPKLAVMRWKGTRKKTSKPVALVGKGVVFDSGGISIKPGAGMEDMKGDMGGAAAVVGTMHAIAARKAKVDVVGVVGLVENMPDGKAQRPGDIVTSMSGQTIEVINTDAEGRLVLCDALHYTIETFKPTAVIDLATLTGAIIVALGHERAGLFSNSDALAEQLSAAGEASGDLVWRMPLGKAYDKLIDSKFADMKNVGGRWGGSVTAAQFLKRFVGDTDWAHLDVAGTAMGSPKSDVNQSWGSGFGVRLLDRYLADNHEG